MLSCADRGIVAAFVAALQISGSQGVSRTVTIDPPPNATFAGPIAISPDGSLLAFGATPAGGVMTLWVRSLQDGAKARALQGTEDATYPFWSPDGRALAFFAGGGSRRDPVPFPQLTEREREILDLVARGLTNAAIARKFVLSDKTVRNHVSNVFAKLQVAGRAEAVARARDAGLGSSTDLG